MNLCAGALFIIWSYHIFLVFARFYFITVPSLLFYVLAELDALELTSTDTRRDTLTYKLTARQPAVRLGPLAIPSAACAEQFLISRHLQQNTMK